MRIRLTNVYFLAIVFLALMFGGTLYWEMLSFDAMDSCSSICPKPSCANSNIDGHRLSNETSSMVARVLEGERRPLFVRFDWYSKKTTPVHVG